MPTPPTSRTMAIATTTQTATSTGRELQSTFSAKEASAKAIHSASISVGGVSPIAAQARPLTATEQYWAARALTAEALLNASTAHRQDLASVANEAEAKKLVCD